jgi:hypothetical protein
MSTAREATTRLAELLRREHVALADFLVALAGFHRERRWVELGYSSLFSFLVRELGLSKGAAFYRNRAAELIERVPAIVEPLRDGRLRLSSVAELSDVLTAENYGDVLPRYFHLSRFEAKEVTAELKPEPAPPLRTVVTAVPPRDAPAVSNHSDTHVPWSDPGTGQPGFLENLAHARAAVPDVASPPAAPRPARVAVQPLTAELTRLHVTVPRRLLEKLAAARDALSHSHPRASDVEILELGLDLIVDRHRKRRGIGAKPRKAAGARRESELAREDLAEPATAARPAKAAPAATTDAPVLPPPPSARSRHVPAQVWRAVWERDQGRCVWPVDDGGVCGSTRRLQLDHVEGWALGAETTVEGCRLLCEVHNDLHARELYGDAVIDRYRTGPRGGCCSEAVAEYAAAASSCHRARSPAEGTAAATRRLIRDGASLATATRSSSTQGHRLGAASAQCAA